MDKKEKICISFIEGGNVEGQFAQSLANLIIKTEYNIVDCARAASGLISFNRNRIVDYFLKTECDWLLMLDSDIDLPTNAAEALFDSADSIYRKCMVGIYALNTSGTFNITLEPSIYEKIDDGFFSILDYTENQILEVDGAGLGITLIHRTVLEDIQKNIGGKYPWFSDYAFEDEWKGEDFHFFDLVKKVGHKIYCNTKVKASHLKKINLTPEDLKRYIDGEEILVPEDIRNLRKLYGQ